MLFNSSVKRSSVSDQAKYIIYVLWLLLWFPLSYHLIHLQENVFSRLKAYRAAQSAWESFYLKVSTNSRFLRELSWAHSFLS